MVILKKKPLPGVYAAVMDAHPWLVIWGSILSDVPAVIIVFLAPFPIHLISRSIVYQPYDWDGQLLSIKTPTRIHPEYYSRRLLVIVSDTVGGNPLGTPINCRF